MSSGPGVPKPRRENDPNRQVGPHLSQHWRPIHEGDQTGPMGNVFARLEQPDHDLMVTAWNGPGGNHAEVERDLAVTGEGPYSGIEHQRYVAGPFRTPLRARIAGEALANRAVSNPYDKDAAGTAKYENDSYMEYGRRRR
jgi:hypothetical protein